MSIGGILDVGIGLIFVFLVLGLVVSALQEAIAALLGLRSKYLLEGLSTILAENEGIYWLARRHILPWSTNRDDGSNLFKAVANHALVNGITPSTIPSYVPAGNFATALIETLRGSGAGPVVNQVEQAIAALPDGPARQALSALLAESKNDIDAFKKSVENWFNGAMDRVSGVYKRWTQYFTLIVGIAIAVGINANTITIAERLWNDPNLREAAVKAATDYVAYCSTDPRPSDCPPAEAAPEANAGQPANPPAADQPAADQDAINAEKAKQEFEEAKATFDKVKNDLGAIGYPIGWQKRPQGWIGWLTAILGWLITGLAVSLGAPFWFDMLKTFVNVRGAGASPKDKKTEGAATGQ